MEIFIYGPKTAEAQAQLDKRVAVFHAQYVASRIKKLPCSKQQKLALVDVTVKKIRERKK